MRYQLKYFGMKKIPFAIITGLCFFIQLMTSGCKKYLDAKPDKQLIIPSTVEDLQALMDDYKTLNESDPAAAEMSCDNYYLSDADWSGLAEDQRRLYTWEKDYVFPAWPNQWSYAFDVVFIANSVLDNIDKVPVTSSNQAAWNSVKGQALFHRAKEFSHIAFIWCSAYDPTTAATDLGIPLRLSSDFNKPSIRASVQETYDRITTDLQEAVQLLPITQVSVLRPSKPAAYGLLSRVYLSMRRYELAGRYADSALQLNSTLLNYNTINASLARPFARFNSEVVMDSYAGNYPPLSNNRAKIDSLLYLTYAGNDLRKTIFFRNNNNGTYGFKGTYSGGTGGFTGIANDENYLTRAECHARSGNTNAAMDDLNTLLITRWRSGTFVPLAASTPEEALDIILLERRKELLYRGLRWMDIKRLNKEGTGITLKRIINGQTYLLPPNDYRYAVALPEDVIRLSGMQQNPR